MGNSLRGNYLSNSTEATNANISFAGKHAVIEYTAPESYALVLKSETYEGVISVIIYDDNHEPVKTITTYIESNVKIRPHEGNIKSITIEHKSRTEPGFLWGSWEFRSSTLGIEFADGQTRTIHSTQPFRIFDGYPFGIIMAGRNCWL